MKGWGKMAHGRPDSFARIDLHAGRLASFIGAAAIGLLLFAVGASANPHTRRNVNPHVRGLRAPGLEHDYFHKGLGHSTPMPSWAENRAVHFQPRRGRGTAAELRPGRRGGKSDLPTFGDDYISGLSSESTLTYFGGGVQKEPEPHIVFWGSDWEKAESYSQVRSALSLLFEGLSGSDYQGILTQYFWNSYTPVRYPEKPTNVVHFDPSTDIFVDKSVTTPTNVGHLDVQHEVSSIAEKTGWEMTPNTQILIYAPPGTTYEEGFTGSFCAYHEYGSGVAYSFFLQYGYQPGCGKTLSESLAHSTSHEYAESVTDPYPGGGWAIPVMSESGKFLSLVEIADYCDAMPLKQLPNGALVEPLKDNYRTLTGEGETSNFCEVSDPEPPTLNIIGPATMELGSTGTVILEGDVEPSPYPEVEYYFEYHRSTGWSKATGSVSTSGTSLVHVTQEATEGAATLADRYRLVARIPSNGYKTSSAGRAFGPELVQTPEWGTTLCKTSQLTCSLPDRFDSGTTISASGDEFTIYAELDRVSCSESTLEFSNSATAGHPLSMSISSWAFGGCSELGGAECTVTMSGLPVAATLSWRFGSEGRLRPAGETGFDVSCPTAAVPVDCSIEWDGESTNLAGGNPALVRGSTNLGEAAGSECPWLNTDTPIRMSPALTVTSPGAIYVTGTERKEPTIDPAPVVAPAEESAWLPAKINPQGYETAWQAQYVDADTYFEDIKTLGDEHGFDHAVTTPGSPEGIGDGDQPIDVQTFVSGLEPETTYYYRATASSPEGVSVGEAESFTTIGAPTYDSTFGSEGHGDGQFEYAAGVSVDSTDGTLWVADGGNDRLQNFSKSGEYLSQFATCNDPLASSVNSNGDIYVVCGMGNRLVKYSRTGQLLATLATYGREPGQVAFPVDVLVDSSDNIWVADYEADRIDKFNPADEYVKSLSLGFLGKPWAIDLAPNGNFWVAEHWRRRIALVDQEGNVLQRFGSQGTGDGQFTEITDIAVDDRGYVWAADAEANRIQVFNESGEFITKFGQAGSGEGQFDTRSWLRIALAKNGDFWVLDSGNSRVQKWSGRSFSPTYDSTFGSEGHGDGQFEYAAGVSVDSTDGTLWVADGGNDRLQNFSKSGEYLSQFATCNDPLASSVNSNGDIYVVCGMGNRLVKYSRTGQLLATLATYGREPGQVAFPVDVLVDSSDNIWVADYEADRIDKFNPADEYVKSLSLGFLGKPWAIDLAPNGNFWVAEHWRRRIALVDQEGNVLQRFGSQGTGDGQFTEITDIAVDDRGYVWAADAEANRIQVFNESGEFITKFGQAGSGEGQFDTRSWLRIALAKNGDFWVLDSGNSRVQKWMPLQGWML